MQKEYLGKTKNECDVYVNMRSSHVVTHLAENPQLLDLVKEVLPTLEPAGRELRVDIDMGRTIGTADIAETKEGDDIVYVKRPHRRGYSRFVKNKEPTPTSSITVVLKKSGEHTYMLYTAFPGRLTPSFPGGDYLPEQSKDFWSKHALIWGRQEVMPGTETAKCPW